MKLVKFKNILLLILTGIMLLAGESSAQNKQNVTYWLELAMQEKNVDRKIEYLENVVKLDPGDAESQNNLGVLYKQKGMYSEAISKYKAALKVSSYKTPEFAHYNLGVLYNEMSQYADALNELKAVLAINPKFAKAYNAMGLAYKGMGDFDKATESFKKALYLDPQYLQAEYNLKNVWKLTDDVKNVDKKVKIMQEQANLAAQKGDNRQALKTLQEALRLAPGNPQIQQKIDEINQRLEFDNVYNNAVNQKKTGNLRNLEGLLQQAEKLAENKEDIAQVNRLSSEVRDIMDIKRRALSINKLYEVGVQHLNERDWLKAMTAFTKLLMMDPDNPLAKEKNREAQIGYYYDSGIHNMSLNKWAEAEGDFKNLLQLEPNHEMGKKGLEEARKQLISSQVLYLLEKGIQSYNLGEWGKAESFFEEVLKLAPDNNIALEKLGEIRSEDYRTKNVSPEFFTREDITTPIIIIVVTLTALITFFIFIQSLKKSHFVEDYNRFRDCEESKILYEKMLEQAPENKAVYPLLAEIYHDINQDDKVSILIKQCTLFGEPLPKEETALWILCVGEIYRAVHKMDKAAEEMEKALAMAPEQAVIKNKLCQLYKAMLTGQENPEIMSRIEELERVAEPARKKREKKTTVEKKQIIDKEEDDELSLLKECFGQSREAKA